MDISGIIRLVKDRLRGDPYLSSIDYPLVGFDIETYSPHGFPADRQDPIVTATLAISPSLNLSQGMILVSMLFPPEMEEMLLRLLRSSLSGLSGSLVTYNGERFDIRYTAYRASLYGLDFKEAYAGYGSLDLYRIVKRAWPGLQSYRQKEVERLLGLERLVRDIDGANYYRAFQSFLSEGDAKPLLYNIEDSVGCLRILNSIAAKVLSNK